MERTYKSWRDWDKPSLQKEYTEEEGGGASGSFSPGPEEPEGTGGDGRGR